MINIIGSGPAGISAALYTIRAGIETTVIAKDIGSLEKAEKIQNYYGLTSPISGKELAENGIKQAKELGVKFINDEIVNITLENTFSLTGLNGIYKSENVIFTTGAPRIHPKIKDLDKYEGRGVSYCAVCDGFFYRNKNVGVLGFSEYATHEAEVLKPLVAKVTIFTNGNKSEINGAEKRKITCLKGEKRLEAVVFEDGTEQEIDGLFIAYGTASSTDLARKIGAFTEKNKIIVNESMETNVSGLYAAGDCTEGIMQISRAVYEGALAALDIIKKNKK